MPPKRFTAKAKTCKPIMVLSKHFKSTLYLPDLRNKGILSESDLLNAEGGIMSLIEIKDHYEVNTNFLEHLRVHKNLKQFLRKEHQPIVRPIFPLNIQVLSRNLRGSSHYRKILNKASRT